MSAVSVVFALSPAQGLRYDVRPYFSCLGETLLNLHNVGNEAHDHHPAEKKAN